MTQRITQTLVENHVSLTEIGDMWLNNLKPSCKESTFIKYHYQLQHHIYPYFKEKQLHQITTSDILHFANDLLIGKGPSNKKLSSKSVADIISRMKSIHTFATIHGYKVDYTPSCIHVRHKQHELRVLSISEEDILLSYLFQNMNQLNLGILICLFTGIRLGELCALSWNDISLEEKELHIKRTLQRLQHLDKSASSRTYISIDEPKSPCSIRTIPLPDIILEYMYPYYKEGTYLLTGDATKFIEPRTMQNHFHSILIKCNIKHANFHSLRHTFATRCVEADFDIKSLSEILGHANVNITLNRYVHPTMQLKHENMDKLSNMFRRV